MKSKYSPLIEKTKKKKDKKRMLELHAKDGPILNTSGHRRHRDFYHKHVAQ